MPRITLRLPTRAWTDIWASMRPGRNAPDNPEGRVRGPLQRMASMRPGRNAPDNHETTRLADRST